jgi:hypothetical protein
VVKKQFLLWKKNILLVAKKMLLVEKIMKEKVFIIIFRGIKTI